MSALRAKKAESGKSRAKVLIYGDAGTWKTSLLCQIPSSYYIDTERGSEIDPQYADWLNAGGSVRLFTNSLDEIVQEIRALMTTPHEFRTVSIDPITVPYYEEGDRAALAISGGKDDPKSLADATAYTRHLASAKLKIKRLLRLCKHLDMNVFVTAHGKMEWKNGEPTGRIIYDIFDAMKYDWDLIIEAQKRGKERVGRVEKTRMRGFPEGDIFPFTYQEIASRYSWDVFGEAASVRELATADEIKELRDYLGAMKDGEETIGKMLAREDVSSIDDLSASFVRTALDHFRKAASAAMEEK